MGTDNERLTIEVDERGGVFVGERWVATVVGQAAIDLTREAFAAANEPVGMTVPEMIEWLDGGGELEWFNAFFGRWERTGLGAAAGLRPEVRRPQYRRKAKAEVVADKVPLTRLIGRTLVGEPVMVVSVRILLAREWQWWDGLDRWRVLPIDDDGLVAVKPIEAS